MSRLIDLTGMTFGMLTVVERRGSARNVPLWLCRCTCGGESTVRGTNLRRGNTKSCGCMKRRARHGMHKTRIYRTWKNMISRTTNPKAAHYERYGGRGITVCEAWRTFEGFYADMGPTYADGLTIERINNDRGYEPDNCRWATVLEQGQNKATSTPIEWRGYIHGPAQWERLLGLKRSTVTNRLRNGWSVERALTKGADPKRLAEL